MDNFRVASRIEKKLRQDCPQIKISKVVYLGHINVCIFLLDGELKNKNLHVQTIIFVFTEDILFCSLISDCSHTSVVKIT